MNARYKADGEQWDDPAWVSQAFTLAKQALPAAPLWPSGWPPGWNPDDPATWKLEDT